MGWCSGTEIFDKVVDYVIHQLPAGDREKRRLLCAVIDALEDHDWDCQQDSRFYSHPTVQAAMKKLHPTWFDESEVSNG